MPINNTAKPTTSINNTPRVLTGDTWATITTTWATETRTWGATSSRVNNSSKPSTSINNTPKP